MGTLLHVKVLCVEKVNKLSYVSQTYLDIKSLHCNELWSLELQENVGRITSLVSY